MIENSSTDERVALAAPRKLCSLILGLLLLALGGKAASASDPELCDRAGADPDAGIPACTRLLEHPSAGANVPAAYNNRGVAKVRKGDLDDAVKDFTGALDRNPNYADAFKNRGIVHHMLGDYDAAIDDFNRALRLKPKSPDLYNARGAALFQKEEYDRAIADFDKAIALDPNYKKTFINRGLAYHLKLQLDRAIADFDRFVGLVPNEPIGYLDRASVRMDKGDFKGAVADYNDAIRLDPNNSGAYTRRGEAWRLQGNLQQALADHNKAIELNPNDKEAYNNRALAFKDQGNLDKAIEDCDHAIMLNPKFYLAYANRGLIRRLKRNLGGSLTDLNKAITLDPRSPVALTFRGDTLRESGNYNGAMADFNKAILILPDFVAAYTGRGLTYEKIGDLANAKADFEKAASLPPAPDGLAKSAQDVAREHLAALAAKVAARPKESAGDTWKSQREAAAKAREEFEREKAEDERRVKAATEAAAKANEDLQRFQKEAERRAKAVPSGAAASGADLASQALSDLSQTTIQEASMNPVKTVSERREKERRAQEEERCAEGFSRVDGTCEHNRAAPPAPARPPPKILETGYSLLKDIGGEERGYGLYSYAILVNNNDRSAKFLNDVFGVPITTNTTPPIEETAAQPSQTNILYITLKRNKVKEWSKRLKLGKEAALLAYANNFYDYKVSRTLLNHLCVSPAKEIKSVCEGDLSRGPYIFAYAKPASKVTPVPPPFLFMDLSDIHERAFPEFIAAFKAQVKREDISDRAKIDTLRLTVLNVVLTTSDWLVPVRKAVADIVYSASGHSEKDKK